MKKGILVSFILLFSLFMFVGSSLAETITLRWAHPSPNRGYEIEWIEWIQNEIEKRTNERVKIEVYWGGSLAGFKEMPDAIKSGVADVGWISSSYYSGYGTLATVGHATTIFNPEPNALTYMEKWIKLYDNTPYLKNEFINNNLMIPIVFIYYDEYWLFSTKKIENVNDLKGLKIRLINEPFQIAGKGVGASPVFLGAGEIYSALDKGIIDAATYSPDTALRFKTYEVTKYVTRANLQPGIAYWCMNLNSMNKLSKNDMNIILEVGREASLMKAEFLQLERERALNFLIEYGLEVFEFSSEDKKTLDSVPELKEYTKKWIQERESNGLEAKKFMSTYCDVFGVVCD